MCEALLPFGARPEGRHAAPAPLLPSQPAWRNASLGRAHHAARATTRAEWSAPAVSKKTQRKPNADAVDAGEQNALWLKVD